jgi:lysyl endopeptidase
MESRFLMRSLFLCVLVGTIGIPIAHGETADYFFVEPTTKAAAQPVGPVAASALATMLEDDFPRFSVDTYAGQNDALKRAGAGPSLQVGAGITLDWTDTPLFDTSTYANGRYHWRAAVQSIDATALRLKVDLNALKPNDQVWVIDGQSDQALGPYSLTDATPEGRWLPTVSGDSATLWVTTESDSVPALLVSALSHYYESPLVAKGTNPCPIPVDCISNTALTEVSTGIGRLTITDDQGSSALCSGALINNANTADLEAYFLTADHCFQDYQGTIFASGLEVIWDFRASGCTGSDPALSQLPRSTGSAFLGNSATLDGMLLSLSSVPVGTRGRAYLGWDTRTPVASENVVCLHHPAGDSMKQSIGTVTRTGVDTSFGQGQTTLNWSEGITEGGSSGSPSMFDDGNFRIFGMLSNGNFQSCGSTAERVDQYSSFRAFFDQIGGFLVDATPPTGGTPSIAPGGATGGGGNGGGDTLTGCLMGTAKPSVAPGDLLVAGLALLTMATWGSLRARQ